MPVDESPIPESIARWWRDKTPEQIASIASYDGRILWPETVRKRLAGGGIAETPCYLQMPEPIEKMQAVVATNMEVAKVYKITDPARLPLSREEAVRMIGEVEWGELHSSILMAFCIVEAKPIEGREDGARRLMFQPSTIIREIGLSGAYNMYKRVELYRALEDVRINEITPEMLDDIITKLARCMSLAPLYDFSGAVQAAVVVSMAVEIIRLRASSSSSDLPSISMPD